jgi:sulfur-carrier protein
MDGSDLVTDRQMRPVEAETINILYFARLREIFGRDSERIALPPSVNTVEALREHLRARGGAWATELDVAKPVRMAVNQELVSPGARLDAGDEVAFFPPVTGG